VGRPETYGVFKAANEESARFYARDYATPSIGLRPASATPTETRASRQPSACPQGGCAGPSYTIPFYGRIDLQYVQDVAAAFVGATVADQTAAEVFDLHGDLVDVAEVVSLIEQEVPESAGQITIGRNPVPGRVEFDDAPLRAVVGELPKTSLAEGIRSSVEVFRRQAEAGILTRDGFEAATRPS
jgi:nucleoside-diphosphate-sugar epimerase